MGTQISMDVTLKQWISRNIFVPPGTAAQRAAYRFAPTSLCLMLTILKRNLESSVS